MAALSPEDMFHQKLFDEDADAENLYMPKPGKKLQKAQPVQIQFQDCQILLRDESQLNKKVIDFFKNNLRDLNNNKLMFEWIIVYEEEMELYEDQGIEKFPVMIIEDTHITGVNNIIKALKSILVKETNTCAPNYINREKGEELKDYFMDELNSQGNDNNNEDDDDFSSNLSQRMATMNTNRQNNGLHTISNMVDSAAEPETDIYGKVVKPKQSVANLLSSINLPKVNNTFKQKQPNSAVNIAKKISNKSADDDLMMRYLENQEETDMN